MTWRWSSYESINDVNADDYNKIFDASADGFPFLKYEFLSALEGSRSVGKGTGWTSKHILVWNEQTLVGFLPGYIKTHSYGEYVFDYSWANAYQQYGKPYYPKWINAIPFTPVTGPRILIDNSESNETITHFLANNLSEICQDLGVSSLHFLFTPEEQSQHLKKGAAHQRLSVQFNWHNKGYADFSDFLATMTARRRKSIRKEREKLSKLRVNIKRYSGAALSKTEMRFFYLCYQQTYLKRSGHQGYLTEAFFFKILEKMPENILLFIAEQDDKPVASALLFKDQKRLYGRYWGSLEDVDGLHFETCYYQGIEFAIEERIQLFNPGTQGEHKILRGFEPTVCFSNHYLLDNMFNKAVADFLMRESPAVLQYYEDTKSLLPFKQFETK